jgi:hypothetical protein
MSEKIPTVATRAALRRATWPDGRPSTVQVLRGKFAGVYRWVAPTVPDDGSTRIKIDPADKGDK